MTGDQLLIDYMQHGRLPDDLLKGWTSQGEPCASYIKTTLYSEEAAQAMREVHSGVCGAHQSGAKLHFQIKRMGYYWPTMFHANFIHQSPEPLHPTTASWPFDSWGMYMVGGDGGKLFNNKMIADLCARFKFKKYHSSMYYPQANDLVEAFNKILCNILRRTPTQPTPYALVYDVEVVLPLEVQIPSLRVAMNEGFTQEEAMQLRV
ncbi:hypothetical protein LIER_29767 [Lithospermum erythrorhizon]|uniref:Integrase catalytic domain-containing protein n=1 Tax=Lithospermum erythrorhizon TaxID=34254 RepID=A0AAV3RM97_LITER